MESQNRTPLSEFHFHFWAHIVACSHSGESGATKRFSWELHTTSQLGASRVLNCVSICDFVVVVVQLLFIYFTILYWFCHTSTWIRHRCTWVPNPELPLPPPSPYHLSGSSQCTSPKHPVSCIEPRLAIHFLHDSIHVSMITLYVRQQKRHRCIEQSFGLWGRGRGWDDFGE